MTARMPRKKSEVERASGERRSRRVVGDEEAQGKSRGKPFADGSAKGEGQARRQMGDLWPIDDEFDPRTVNEEMWDVFCDDEGDPHVPEMSDYWNDEGDLDEI